MKIVKWLLIATVQGLGTSRTESKRKIKSVFGAALSPEHSHGTCGKTTGSVEENEDNKEFSHKLDIYQQSFYTGRSNVVHPVHPFLVLPNWISYTSGSRASCLHSLHAAGRAGSCRASSSSVIDVETGKKRMILVRYRFMFC